MQTENKFFDDISKFLNGAAGTVAGMTREAEAGVREKAKEWIGGLEFVSRDEFEAVKAIAVAAQVHTGTRNPSRCLAVRKDSSTPTTATIGGPYRMRLNTNSLGPVPPHGPSVQAAVPITLRYAKATTANAPSTAKSASVQFQNGLAPWECASLSADRSGERGSSC